MASRRPSLEDVRLAARLLGSVPGFLRRPLAPGPARDEIAARLARRDADFLLGARRMIYGVPASPYRRLLARAGCEPGDLAALVARDGLEGALAVLLREGVYLTVDELKGRRPVVRGATSFSLDPSGLRNPDLVAHLTRESSGSRGAPTTTLLDLRGIREQAVDMCAFVSALGGIGGDHAVWYVPGGTATNLNLRLAVAGARPARWFSQLDPADPAMHPRYRWSARILRAASFVAGCPLPPARHVPVQRPGAVLDWVVSSLRAGRVPHLWTFASNAVLVCREATRAGVDLGGARFILSGEPITKGRIAAVRATGATAIPRYAASECGQIGFGCLAAERPDDLHFPSDLLALVQPGDGTAGGTLAAGALLLTTIRPMARLVLLNVSLGDAAVVAERRCGCPLDAVGWTTHLHTIRSEEKVTVGGMTFPDAHLRRVLDETLPARFGGSPVDYQLREEEGEGGTARLRLLVDPTIGPLDAGAVADAFLEALARGSELEHVMALAWRSAGLLTVERRSPVPTANGKIHHLRQSGS